MLFIIIRLFRKKIKILIMLNFGKGMEKVGILYVVSRSENWYNFCGNNLVLLS